MPSKSASMNPMPMQTKIGDASLKFGPDWLRALSSDNSTGNSGTATGSGQSGGGWVSGSGGGGGSGERMTNERSPAAYHHQPAARDREKESDRRYANHSNSSNTNNSGAAPLAANRFKLSEYRYTREEILTLYDKNLQAPNYLTTLGTLFIEKMQPPLAFSQPSEEELRTWHVPQPESSRPTGPVSAGLSPLSRGGGFAIRGRGVDRGGRGGGRGGRGGYYARPHEEEDPRFRQHSFARSLSAHERNWVPERERNGLAGSPPEAESSRGGGGGGGNWRNRNSDSYSKGRYEEPDDGWRNKPRWRREDEEEYTPPRSNPRRVHKSWSDDGTQDNLPEWAKDNPSDESGTFDSSGAFHDEDRYSAKTNAFEMSRRAEAGDHLKDKDVKEDSHSIGSQHDRVQKRVERGEKPNSLKEVREEEPPRPRPKPKTKPKSHSPILDPQSEESSSLKDNRRSPRAGSEVSTREPKPSQKPVNEEHYRSMIEEADSLVAKLIEDEAALGDLGRESSFPPVTSIPSVASSIGATQQRPTPPPEVSRGSSEIWFYRDPQGNVQGPFASSEMSLWLNQGYFSGNLSLRRECDQIFIMLSDMGKLYGKNPFVNMPDTITPPPLLDESNGTSALDPLLAEPHSAQAQFIQKQQQQQLLQAHQHQHLLSLLQHSQTRKESEGWTQGASNPSSSAQIQQAQMLLNNMVKSAGGMGGSDGTQFDLQSLFQRQLKGQERGVPDYRNPNAPTQMPPQQSDGVGKGVLELDPIQSLLHQLTNMTNTQGQMPIPKSGPVGGNGWGAMPPNAWNSNVNVHNPSPSGSSNAANPLWEYREQYLKLQQLKAEEDMLAVRKKQEEELERKRIQEEDEARKRIEEQKRMEMEQEQKRKAYEELLQQQQAAAAELARQREELIMQQRLQQQELARQRMEQERALEKQRLEALQKMEQQRAEQQRLEQQRIEQARLEKEREEEREREREREREEQERRLQLEFEEQKRREERRLQQEMQVKKMQELQQQKMPWNTGSGSQAPRTLLEIQEEETMELEARKAQQLVLKKKQEDEQRERAAQQQSKGMSLTWAQPIQPQQSVPIKTLAEIQAEEAAKLEDKRREKEVQARQLNIHQTWNSTLTWANRASLNAPPASAAGGKGNGGGVSSVWEDRKKWEAEQPPLPLMSSKISQLPPGAGAGKGRGKESDDLLKLLQDAGRGNGGGRKQSAGAEDSFSRWCFETVDGIGGSVDVPTFINFLKEVESPFEVNDYIRSYLGDGKEARDFGREFLERRSRWKNARRGGEKEVKSFEDNLYRPASALNATTTEFQEVKGKKGKKGKMQKVSTQLLGFNTTAAPDRLNVGKRDYGDGSDN